MAGAVVITQVLARGWTDCTRDAKEVQSREMAGTVVITQVLTRGWRDCMRGR